MREEYNTTSPLYKKQGEGWDEHSLDGYPYHLIGGGGRQGLRGGRGKMHGRNEGQNMRGLEREFERMDEWDKGDHEEGYGMQNRGNENRVRRGEDDEKDREMKHINMKVPPFQGKIDLEVYFQWKKENGNLIEYHEYSERTKVKLAISSFFEYTLVWWDQVSSQLRCMVDQSISNRELLKKLMRGRFVPLHYYN
jgi:hypothetical protein